MWLTGLPLLELETSGFQADPKPWGDLSGSVILYLPQAFGFVPSTVSLGADGSVLLQALCAGSEYQSSRSRDGTGIRLQAGLPEHPQLLLAEMQAQSGRGGPGWSHCAAHLS